MKQSLNLSACGNPKGERSSPPTSGSPPAFLDFWVAHHSFWRVAAELSDTLRCGAGEEMPAAATPPWGHPGAGFGLSGFGFLSFRTFQTLQSPPPEKMSPGAAVQVWVHVSFWNYFSILLLYPSEIGQELPFILD